MNDAVPSLRQRRSIQAFARTHGSSIVTAYRLIERGELMALSSRSITSAGQGAQWLASLPRVGGAK